MLTSLESSMAVHPEACYTVETLLSLRARPATGGARIIRQVWIPACLLEESEDDGPEDEPAPVAQVPEVRHVKDMPAIGEDTKALVRADADRMEVRAAMRAEARAARAKDKAAQALQAVGIAAAERAKGADLLKELLRLPNPSTTAPLVSGMARDVRLRSPRVSAMSAAVEACRSSLNARAAEFVPSSSTAAWLRQPLAAMVQTLAKPAQPLAFVPSTAPPPRETLSGPDIFSIEEQKLLGLQLCEELGGLVGDASPGSARTSYGTERETGESDEDELRAKALAIRASMFSVAPPPR